MTTIFDYPDKIYVKYKTVCINHIIYRKHAIDDMMIYYRLIHEDELEYEDEGVEEGDYMLSVPNQVYRFLALYRDDCDNYEDVFELGDFTKNNMSDQCLFTKNNINDESLFPKNNMSDESLFTKNNISDECLFTKNNI